MTLRPLALTALLIGVPALRAQAPEDRATLGFKLQMVVPSGDIHDLNGGQPGFSAAGYLDLPMEELGGISFRPILQVDYYPKGDALGLSGNRTRMFALLLGVETVWRPNDDGKGPYLHATVGAQNWRIVTESSAGDTTVGGTKLGLDGGVGWQWTRHLAFEARMFWSPVDGGVRATGVAAGFAWTF